jgi:hypothetical protein
MTVEELIAEVVALLQREGRLSYRMLKRRFDLDDDYIADLKAELIKAKRLAVDEDGEVLVWIGNEEKGERTKLGNGEKEVVSSQLPVASPQPPAPSTQVPASGLRTSDPGRWTPPHLAERIRAEQAAREDRSATDEERKIITALFADLAGFTALAKDLDPEETRTIIDPALQLMMDAVHRYEGYVAQSLGDGIFALFGAPIAHEDHPQRALYAALLMQDEMRRYATRVRAEKGVPLQIRVGINTGKWCCGQCEKTSCIRTTFLLVIPPISLRGWKAWRHLVQSSSASTPTSSSQGILTAKRSAQQRSKDSIPHSMFMKFWGLDCCGRGCKWRPRVVSCGLWVASGNSINSSKRWMTRLPAVGRWSA